MASKYIGQKYGTLTVLNTIPGNSNKFECKCDCGRIVTKFSHQLRNNKNVSCGYDDCPYGLTQSEKYIDALKTKYLKYINTKINHLLILDYQYFPNEIVTKRHQFKYKCDCGEIGYKPITNILSNKVKSCGSNQCPYKNESNLNKKQNAIDKYKSYIGQKFNHLTILDFIYDETAKNKYDKFKFKCQCDCGHICYVFVSYILNNIQLTCADDYCQYHENSIAYTLNKYKSLIGQKIRNWLILDVIYNPEEENFKHFCLKVKCDCGQISIKAAQNVLNNSSIGCANCTDSTSTYEQVFEDWILSSNIQYTKHNKLKSINFQSKYELDFILESKLGIELNGLFTHSTFNNCNKNLLYIPSSKPINYHLNKLQIATEQNFEYLQFWNFELLQKFDIVKSIILNKLNRIPYKEYARNCYVIEIDKKTSDEFLIKNHIQGTVKSDSVRLGLFYKKNNNLVAVMTFGKARYSNHQWELYRYANYIYTSIVGAASKLFKYFIKNYNPESIVSYSDRRIFDSGKVYEVLGFKLDHVSKPDYWYFKSESKLYHRSQFMKHLLSTKLEKFDPNLTEVENMENNGYLRVYDCGNKVYTWNKLR